MTPRALARGNFPSRAAFALLASLSLAAPGVAFAKGPSGKAKTEHKKGGAKNGGHKTSSATSQAPAQPQAPKPAAIDAAPVAFADPAVVTARSASGLSIVVTERQGAAGTVLALRLPFGSSADPVDQGGLVAVTARAVASAAVPERETFRARGGSETVRVEPDAVTFVLSAPAGEGSAAVDLLAAELKAPIANDAAENARASLTTTSLPEEAEALRDALVYQGFFPYEHRATGSAIYLAKVQPASVETFRAAHFNVSGATIGVVVPTSGATVVSKLKDTFAGAAAAPMTAPDGSLAEQTNQRASEIQEAGAPSVLNYGWALRGASARELETLELAGHLLGDGGRVVEALGKAGIEGRAHAKVDHRAGPSLFTLEVELPSDADVSKAKHAVDDCLAELGKHAPGAPDVMRAKRDVSIARARELDSDDALAVHLARGGFAADEQQTLGALSAEEVPKVAARFLGPLTRSVVETRDPSRAKAPPHGSPAVVPAHAPTEPTKPASKKDAEPKHHGKGHKKS